LLCGLLLVCAVKLPALSAPGCAQCVVKEPAHLDIIGTFTLNEDDLPSPSFALDGADGESIWLASDPQYRSQVVERIAGGRQLSVVTRDVPISGNVASDNDVAAALPLYNSVTVWSARTLKARSYNVPTSDNIGTLSDSDELSADPQGSLWLYRRRDPPAAAASLYVLRKGDNQFAAVTLPPKSWAGLDCKRAMRIHSANGEYEIDPSSLALHRATSITCAWSSDPLGVRHTRTDGTQKYLQLTSTPADASVPLPLAFNVDASGNTWVWTPEALCRIQADEHVSCAREPVEERDSAIVAVAKDGSLWFKTDFQTLVHARFVRGS
jgi:hypothetical protein